ncbi:PAAR domain-containing protein [Citrobacter sp. OP27]
MERMKGFYLKVGDKTSCGGYITSSSSTIFVAGKAVTRMGDKYTCGEDWKTYSIEGGVPGVFKDGKLAAGTGHSKGTCKCQCEFIPVGFALTYGYWAEAIDSSSDIISSDPIKESRISVDAGFCILPNESSPKRHDPLLFTNPPANVRQLYNILNPEMPKKPGSILIVVDPEKQISEQIETLQIARDRIDTALAPLTTEEAKILYENRAAVDMFSSQIFSDALSTTGDVLGYVSEAGGEYYKEINSTLKDIEKLYQNTYRHNNGIISGQEFFGQRQQLFAKLNIILNRYSKSQLELNQFQPIKKALGLSTSSIMHDWNQTGIRGIEGYATYIENSAKLMKMMRTTGYVGMTLDFASYSNNVYEACAIGRAGACRKAAIIEYSKFGAKQITSITLASAAGKASQAACMWVLGLATAEIGGLGSTLCLITGIGATIAVGKAVGDSGEYYGEVFGSEIIYDTFFESKK